jgi:hypothetical protein
VAGSGFFFPIRCFEAAGLQEGERDHAHEGVSVKSLPRSPLEVIEAELFLQLLMGLLADQPDLFAGKMLLSEIADPLRRAICHPHAHGSKARREVALGTAPPTHGQPSGRSSQHWPDKPSACNTNERCG